MMDSRQSRVHHYVPRWHQRRFLPSGHSTFHYLDLHPTIVYSAGVRHERTPLLKWGPNRCFYKDELYTLRVGGLSSDQIETEFFGAIDRRGQAAVEVFGRYEGLHSIFGGPGPFHDLVAYMGAQRFRTPMGLDWLRESLRLQSHSQTLVSMQGLFQFHTTMWAEGIWEIVRARNCPTKFIVSDNPVTFFNRMAFPKARPYPEDVGLERVGTRTIFPLSLDACLVVTHTQLVRDPWVDPFALRPNARSFQRTMKNLQSTQFGRELEEDEVLRINFILKKRATRYIAAAEQNWLYPERRVSTTSWAKLDDDWFLFPNLYKVPFTSEIIVGWKDGSSWAMDEYGRHPTNPNYRDQELHEREWAAHIQAQKEWAKKRLGRSVAHVDNFCREDEVSDSIMQDYLAEEGLIPPRKIKPGVSEQQVAGDRTDQTADADPDRDEPAAARPV